MLIIEICIVILTVIYVTKTVIELSIILKVRKKLFSVMQSLDIVSRNIQALSSDLQSEGRHIKSTVHDITEETKVRIHLLKESIDKINESLFMFSSIVHTIANIGQGFFKKEGKENTKMGDDSL